HDRLDLVIADTDAALDLRALQTLPGDFALDLAPQRLDAGIARIEERRELGRRLLYIVRNALDGLVDIRLLDVDLLCLRSLNFERFVDEVPEHLLTQPLSLFGWDLTAVSDRQQGKALLDVRLSDDVAVHDRRRLDDGRYSVAEDLRILRQLQRLAGVDLSL